MAEALELAWNWFRKVSGRKGRIVILSDGAPNSGANEILAQLKSSGMTGIPHDAVFIGASQQEAGATFLKRVCQMTGGNYQFVQEQKMLAYTMKALSPKERPMLGAPTKEQ